MVDEDVYCAPTCEWIFPNGKGSASSDHYRSEELQRIMDAASRNPQAVRDYKDWKREQDRLDAESELKEEEEEKCKEEEKEGATCDL